MIRLIENLHIFTQEKVRCAATSAGPLCYAAARNPTGKLKERTTKNLGGLPRMLKYLLLSVAILYVAWSIFKAVMERADR